MVLLAWVGLVVVYVPVSGVLRVLCPTGGEARAAVQFVRRSILGASRPRQRMSLVAWVI